MLQKYQSFYQHSIHSLLIPVPSKHFQIQFTGSEPQGLCIYINCNSSLSISNSWQTTTKNANLKKQHINFFYVHEVFFVQLWSRIQYLPFYNYCLLLKQKQLVIKMSMVKLKFCDYYIVTHSLKNNMTSSEVLTNYNLLSDERSPEESS